MGNGVRKGLGKGAAAGKRKRMTQKERDARARAKKELQELGLLPPDKPRLNRKRFKEEVLKSWQAEIHPGSLADSIFLSRAVIWMLADIPDAPVTLEQIGLLKTMKLAVELKRLHEKVKEQGESCTLQDEYDKVVKTVIGL